MFSAKLKLSDGTIVPVMNVWTEYPNEAPGTHAIAVSAGDLQFRRIGLTPAAAEELRESLMAGGMFDEGLNKLQ